MQKIIAVLIVTLLATPIAAVAQDTAARLPERGSSVGDITPVDAARFASMLSRAQAQRFNRPQRRSISRAVTLGALIGGGTGTAVMLASPHCTQNGYCGPFVGIGAGVGAGIGALTGLVVGITRR